MLLIPETVFDMFLFSTLRSRIGLYLVHWPLVVWFGDCQLNTIHSDHTWFGRQPGFQPFARDILIAIVSCVVTWISFFRFEVPMMKLGAKVSPSKVIGAGFAASALIGGFVIFVTSSKTGSVDSIIALDSSSSRDSAFNMALLHQSQQSMVDKHLKRVCAHCRGCDAWPLLAAKAQNAEHCAAIVLNADLSKCSRNHFVYSEIGNGSCACAPPVSMFHCTANNSEWFENTEEALKFGHSSTVFSIEQGARGNENGESLLLLGDSMLQFLYIHPWRDMASKYTSMADSSRNGVVEKCQKQMHPPVWFRQMLPGFVRGMPLIQLFGSNKCTWCKVPTYPTNCKFQSADDCPQQIAAKQDIATTKHEVIQRIEQAQARNVLILEGHFMRGWADEDHTKFGFFGMEDALDEALRNLLLKLADNGAKHVFLQVPMNSATTRYTSSFFSNRSNFKGNLADEVDDFIQPQEHVHLMSVGAIQRAAFLSMIKRHSCAYHRGPTRKLYITVLDYHTLSCPGYNRPAQQNMQNKRYPNTSWPLGAKEYCPTTTPVRGLSDGVGGVHIGHGPTAEWLAAQLQLMIKIGRSQESARNAEIPFADNEVECLQAAYPWKGHEGACPVDFASNSSVDLLSCTPTPQSLKSMVTTEEICISGQDTTSKAW